MKIRKLIACLCAPFLFGLWHAPAHAAKFGTSEKIRYVADVKATGPQGEKLFLGRKIAEHHFLLPYSIEDQGYVLGIADDSKRFFRMPQGAQLEALQQDGLLPKPLPPFELDTWDNILGNLLWIVLAGLALYAGWEAYRRKKKEPADPEAGADFLQEQPVTQELPAVTRFSGKPLSLPMKLYTGRMKTFMLFLMSLALVTMGFLLLEENKIIAYLCIGFFGLCALVIFIQLFSGRSYLLIESHQFTTYTAWNNSVVAWKDVAPFRVMSISGNKMIGWNYSPGYAGQATGRKLAAAMSGFEGALPDTYGLKIDELCDLMNEVRSRSVTSHI